MVLSSLVALPENAAVVARHTFPQAPSQDAGVTIATRPANPDDALLQEVVLLEPEMLTPAMESLRSRLAVALNARNVTVLSYTLKDIDLLRGKPIISLLEAERAFTKDIDEKQFENFRRLCISNPYMLWISGSSLPFSASTGLLRVVRTEIPQIRLPHFGISAELDLDSDHCCGCILDVFMATQSDQDEQQIDMEYQEIGGKVHVPRSMGYESFDREIDMSKPSPRSIKSSLRCKGRPLKLVARTLGSLESLQWVDDEAYVQALGDDDVELKITGVPIHDVDAKNVMGDSLSRSIGHEAQGIVTRGGKNVNDLTPGQRVVSLYQGSCRTMIRQHRSFVVALPSSCGFNIPPAIPLINALRAIKIAKIEESDDVLVHKAASAIGQLVIQAIQQKGARVFITLERSDQKQAMCQKYGIPSAHVLSLADMNFVKSVQRLTQGRGVDVVLNTLGDETFPYTWSCVAEGGRFVDLSESANKVMIDTTKQISYHKIDTRRVFSDRTSDVAKLLFDAYQLIESGTFDRDHQVTHFKAGDARKAFEKVHFNKTQGSVLLELDDDSCIAVAPAKPSRLELNPAATYVIPGGLGGLGPGIISMMVECGAKHIVTISRSGARSEKQKKYVQGWRDEGCHVEALCCDCTDKKQLGEFICHAQKNKWNIRGVVQLAMVLNVSPLIVTHRRGSS
jgi:NADPH:quinone reductase-like Zn-dependent oxidoreductase